MKDFLKESNIIWQHLIKVLQESESLQQTSLSGVLRIQPPESTWLLGPISCFLGELFTGVRAKISPLSIVSPLHFHTYLKGFLPNSTISASWEKLRKHRKQKNKNKNKTLYQTKKKMLEWNIEAEKNELVGEMKGQFICRNGGTGDKQQSWERSRAKEKNQWLLGNNNHRGSKYNFTPPDTVVFILTSP